MSFEYLFGEEVKFQKHVLPTLIANAMDDANAEGCDVHILCFRVISLGVGVRFPFVQFLLDKRPFNHSMLDLPFISVKREDLDGCETQVIKQVRLVCGDDASLCVSYLGACLLNNDGRVYAVVQISDSDVVAEGMSSQTRGWFALPSEIVNSLAVCGFYVDEWITRLFIACPELMVVRVRGDASDSTFASASLVPDIGYTFFPDIYTARLACMFGSRCDPVAKRWLFSPDLLGGNGRRGGVVVRNAVFYDLDSYSASALDLFCPLSFHVLRSGDGSGNDCIL